MTFSESNRDGFDPSQHPRAADGKFAEKTGTAAEVSLPDPYGEMTRILIESDEFWDAEHKEWNTEKLARNLRSEGLSTLSVSALNAIIRQDQWRRDGILDSEGLAAEILRPRSEDEVTLASHLAGGSGVVFSGKDSTTPEGYFTAFGKGEGSEVSSTRTFSMTKRRASWAGSNPVVLARACRPASTPEAISTVVTSWATARARGWP